MMPRGIKFIVGYLATDAEIAKLDVTLEEMEAYFAEHEEALAENGDISKIDLRISDISKKSLSPTLELDTTASNFGKLSDIASGADVALGVLNMVFETVGMLALFAARSRGVRDIVLTGNLTGVPYAKTVFDTLSSMFDVRFIIHENAQFATVIGTALCG